MNDMTRGAQVSVAPLGSALPTTFDQPLSNPFRDIGVIDNGHSVIDLRRPTLVIDEPMDKSFSVSATFTEIMPGFVEAMSKLVNALMGSAAAMAYMHSVIVRLQRTERHTANSRRNTLRRKRKARKRRRG